MVTTAKIKLHFFPALAAVFLLSGFYPAPASAAPATFWQDQCIDTMKDSRDNARNWASRSDLPRLVAAQISAIKNMGANCVSLGTPYDDEFVPFLKVWVNEAHKQGLKVWFRGNLSGWDGWFSYPILSGAGEHHQKITRFILNNPTLFQNSDIFSPATEAEAGKVIGDPRNSQSQKTRYLNFLVDSYNNCQKAFSQIDVKAVCGYFSTNGDVAKYVLTQEVVKQIGNVVVVDHYAGDPVNLVNDLVALHSKLDAQIILGEFGAPVPDINGKMTESQQADFVKKVLAGLVQYTDIIQGVNYWTLHGGSTALLNDDYTPRQVDEVIKSYYQPAVVSGTVKNDSGSAVASATISAKNGGAQVTANSQGQFSIPVPAGSSDLVVSGNSYNSSVSTVTGSAGQQVTKNITLQPKSRGWLSGLWTFIKHLFGH